MAAPRVRVLGRVSRVDDRDFAVVSANASHRLVMHSLPHQGSEHPGQQLRARERDLNLSVRDRHDAAIDNPLLTPDASAKTALDEKHECNLRLRASRE
jgi:hypothetical protein